MYDCGICFGEYERFYIPFCIAGGGTAMLIECSAEKFECDSVEFFPSSSLITTRI